jgi:hypothetical protein
VRAKALLTGCLILLGSGALGAASEHGGERPAAYMGLGFGGRQTALGGAGTSLPGGVAGSVINPAILSAVRTFQVYTQYAFLTQDRTLAYLGLGNRLEKSPLSYAISWAYFSAGGDLEARREPTYEPDYVFSDSEMAFWITTAYRLDADWSVGASFKVLTHWLDQDLGWGMGEDLGLTYRVSGYTRIGVSAQDLFSALRFQNSDSGDIPPAFRAGVSHLFYGPQVILSTDLVYSADLGFEPCGGLEWRVRSGIALRGGWGRDSFRGGFGLTIQGSKVAEEFEYVLSQDTLEDGALLHRVSLGLRFL